MRWQRQLGICNKEVLLHGCKPLPPAPMRPPVPPTSHFHGATPSPCDPPPATHQVPSKGESRSAAVDRNSALEVRAPSVYNVFVPLGEPMLCAVDNWRATSPVDHGLPLLNEVQEKCDGALIEVHS